MKFYGYGTILTILIDQQNISTLFSCVVQRVFQIHHTFLSVIFFL